VLLKALHHQILFAAHHRTVNANECIASVDRKITPAMPTVNPTTTECGIRITYDPGSAVDGKHHGFGSGRL